MTPATQEQIEAACMTRSAESAALYLQSIGLHANRSQCDKALALMLEDGRRKPFAGGGRSVFVEDVSEHSARMGCDALLKAMVTAYQRKAKRLGISFEQAMATSLGNVAVRA